ncbi:hypothetical protein BGX34_005680 [Mortierella sp. NVP85]|nr:hypothetical protein BGX34_005680 [Mortierella sp. NVP85]
MSRIHSLKYAVSVRLADLAVLLVPVDVADQIVMAASAVLTVATGPAVPNAPLDPLVQVAAAMHQAILSLSIASAALVALSILLIPAVVDLPMALASLSGQTAPIA